MVLAAAERLGEPAVLAPAAREQLLQGLWRQLAGMAAPCCYAELAPMQAAAGALGRRRGVYARFVERHPDPARAYPGLALALDRRVEAWLAATNEMLERFATDFNGRRVDSLEPDLGDPHHGGRRVCALVLDDGRSLVYKPRGLGMELAFQRLLGWCAERGLALPRHAVDDRGGYGWAERVAVGWPASRDDRPWGWLLGLLWALGATDAHRENVLPTTSGPVLVDVETLFTDAGSVLEVGMLPCWGPLGRGPGSRTVAAPGWLDAGSDLMRPGPVEQVLVGPPWAADAEAVAAGFAQMVGLLRSEPPPLDAFVGLPVRRVLRPTRDYAAWLAASLRPEHARSGSLPALAPLPGGEAFYERELAALSRRDVPHFCEPFAGWDPSDRLERVDLATELACLRQAIALGPRLEQASPPVLLPGPALDLREAALRLGAVLKEAMVDGGWLGLADGSLVLHQPGFYRGDQGTAMALAALHRLTGDDEARRLALAVLDRPRPAPLGPGLVHGLAAELYGGVLASQLLGRPLDRGPALAAVPEGSEDDVLHGLAGLLLALLAVHAATADPAVLARAVAVGDALLALRPWPTHGQPAAMAGFAHGPAGKAYALGRLALAGGGQRFEAAAGEALAAELPVDGHQVCGWCSGTPGMALARLALGLNPDPAWLHEAATAPAGSLSLCCGLFGRVDVLLAAGETEAAHRLAAAGVAALEGYEPGDHGLLVGGLYRGLAGVVYQLCRLLTPLPSVLLLDAAPAG